MFEMRPLSELVQIAKAGGGMTLDAGMRPVDELVQIARAASEHSARITFKGLKLRPTSELVIIASAGQGAVVFEP